MIRTHSPFQPAAKRTGWFLFGRFMMWATRNAR